MGKYFLLRSSQVHTFCFFLMKHCNHFFALVDTWSVGSAMLQLLWTKRTKVQRAIKLFFCAQAFIALLSKSSIAKTVQSSLSFAQDKSLSTMKIKFSPLPNAPFEHSDIQRDILQPTSSALYDPSNTKSFQADPQVMSENHAAEIVLDTQENSRQLSYHHRWSRPSKATMSAVINLYEDMSFPTWQYTQITCILKWFVRNSEYSELHQYRVWTMYWRNSEYSFLD